MGHRRTRPIVGETAAGTGATYIIVDQACDDTNVQVTAEGTITFTVDWTNENILYDADAQKAVNVSTTEGRYVAPTDATWVNLIASGSADANAALTTPVFALRINRTAGTGTVKYHINQA